MKKVIVIGTGGLAREFTSFFSVETRLAQIVGYYSTNLEEHSKFNLPGALFDSGFTPSFVGTDLAVIAIANNEAKQRLSEKLKGRGFNFPSFVHPSSVVSKSAYINEGVVISPNCVVSPNVRLGPFSYLNFSCGIGHDAILERYLQINPGSQIGGWAIVREFSTVGSGSTILQGVEIGKGSTVGSGSVVFANVLDGVTVLGNPARRIPV